MEHEKLKKSALQVLFFLSNKQQHELINMCTNTQKMDLK
jgi:hypothetical protein